MRNCEKSRVVILLRASLAGWGLCHTPFDEHEVKYHELHKSAALIRRLCLTALAMAFGSLSVCAEPADLQLPDAALKAAEKLRKLSPMQNAEGSASVSGENLNAQDKLAYLRLVEDVRGRLERLAGSSFSGDSYRVSIHAEDAGGEGAPAVIQKSFSAPSAGDRGLATIRIWVTNPAKLDPRDLACELCDGFIGMKVLVASRGDGTAQPPARWFTGGLAHYLEEGRRQDDAEDVVGSWFKAKLEPLWRLSREFSPYASADRRISAQLAAYWLDFPDRGGRLDTLCGELANGRQWTPRLFSETSSGITDDFGADKDFDVWLLGRRQSVLTPGVTRPEMVVRSWHGMLLFPGEDGVPNGVAAGASPALLAARSDEAWVKGCAMAKIDRIMRASAGRGDKFRAAADAYREYFTAVAEIAGTGKKERLNKEGLLEKLSKAEKMLISAKHSSVL